MLVAHNVYFIMVIMFVILSRVGGDFVTFLLLFSTLLQLITLKFILEG